MDDVVRAKYNFYKQYNSNAHSYFLVNNPHLKGLMPSIILTLTDLGQTEDLLTVISTAPKNKLSPTQILRQINCFRANSKLTVMLRKWYLNRNLGNFFELDNTYVQELIKQVETIRQELVECVESQLNMPITSIDLIINSLGTD